ncbi:hypothetical protein ACFC0M_33985 [Streptomyces sp. NPDC056149]|uniref:hypothetical protein n=1 Tax=Streptomyces sp. NPDC056149 TaxID=3345728 RepID=UPI0035DA44DC
MAETAQLQGAPGQEAEVEGGPEPDKLHAVQREILRPAHADSIAAGKPAVQNVEPMI